MLESTMTLLRTVDMIQEQDENREQKTGVKTEPSPLPEVETQMELPIQNQ